MKGQNFDTSQFIQVLKTCERQIFEEILHQKSKEKLKIYIYILKTLLV